MRISDWSSDVCSSDLDEADVAIGIAGYRAHRVAKYLVGSRGEGRFDLAGCRGLLARLQNLHGLDDPLGVFQEIGRSEERRVGTECVSTCKPRCSAVH